MNRRIVFVLVALFIVGLLVFFLVPDPNIRELPTGFCGLYQQPPALQCNHTTYVSASANAFGVGAYYVGGHYFLEFGHTAIQVF
jgi:hypothetical protein